ncbi:MAG: aminoglycoside phosphotransferase [Desulfobacteraceae bacterium]|nr:MAG: aminoglycoside phosphotransferase [Desulfobacteraceae bacterium]
MKALILAAGLGTRLLPHTRTVPKPLFPFDGRTLLENHIEALRRSGCEAIVINTHHLAGQIEAYLARKDYGIPVHVRFEPEILGTGGAIKNVEDFWDAHPFIVVNSDIVTDIDFRAVYDFHRNHSCLATLVLYDYPEINTVGLDRDQFVIGFGKESLSDDKRRTFTGIQVIDPAVLSYIPPAVFSSVIDAYRKMLADGKKVKGFLADTALWNDIGTPQRYSDSVCNRIAPVAFRKAFSIDCGQIHRAGLKGDGSDRKWYRLRSKGGSLILADHGIQESSGQTEFDSFVAIGLHLHRCGIPVPKIHLSDRFSGQVFLEDLGDIHLQPVVSSDPDTGRIFSRYQGVIDLMILMNRAGGRHFDPAWTYQTPAYSRDLILEKECRYFVEAFLGGYCEMQVLFDPLEDEFKSLAEKALRHGFFGFMHRDFQSRNIMIKEENPYLIDFQGGRTGPIQYDLASLLIDPYVGLPGVLRSRLARYCAERLSALCCIDKESFLDGYRYCCITRNLQILGAFGFLTRRKGKTAFEAYIPAAVATLAESVDAAEFPGLSGILEVARCRLPERESGKEGKREITNSKLQIPNNKAK